MDGPSADGLGAREAQRALIVEALAGLRDAHDPEAAAREVMRALDAYIDSAPRRGRETPVADFSRPPGSDAREARWAMWAVLGCGVLATIVAAVVLEGGWLAGVVMLGIWATALFALVNS
ncbi:MAG: hypothetical protein IT200_00535 [Thermoleophilia bacterium]|nr:hypothetical protein [Thermoleophilia bacterium]